ncbi:MAG: acyl-CoA dehydrogenase [Planctomycetes bacterium]|nr:acyl-CoA dehydrogenase [Planctomycetota bacterium]
MSVSEQEREQQMRQAEEILGDEAQKRSFAKGLFFGEYSNDELLPYPDRDHDELTDQLVERLRDFCRTEVDPQRIDRQAEIPATVVSGLGKLGILGACLPRSCGGMELSQASYCRLLEVLGAHCGSTALFVNAHHSIGPRAVVLFGSQDQKQRWLPKMATGEWISAFALTEPEAGSDAANVQTTATPADDGQSFRINGQKRWITNGGIADVLTVMARTPVSGGKETKITAFIVTPDMPGFTVLEKRMEKCGVRGTATSRLEFRDMPVPRANILGQPGKGLRVALTVLDFGRTTFGASCTGTAKRCLELACAHARSRVQFQHPLADFELVKEKIAWMAAGAFAMEACTYQTAALIDSGAGDFMLETAMLKVFSTEVLWRIINDTFQIYGGKAYFTDEPLERMLRDARINMIGEGANDVLRAFTALVGMRDVGKELEGILHGIQNPLANLIPLFQFAGRKLGSLVTAPLVRVRNAELEPDASSLAWLVRALGMNVERLLRTYQLEILERQYQLGRAADAATEIYVSACVLNRMDQLLRDHHLTDVARNTALETGRYYLRTARRRIERGFREMWSNDDQPTTSLANRILKFGLAGF